MLLHLEPARSSTWLLGAVMIVLVGTQPRVVSAECPSAEYRDEASSVPWPAVPASVSAAWPRDEPAVTWDLASSLATIPYMGDASLSSAQEQLGCPHLEPDLANWHDPTTWGGSVPLPPDDVTLPEGTAVLVSSCSLAETGVYGTITVPPTSRLVFADAAIELRAQGVSVQGSLQAGSETCRLRGQVTITLHGARVDSPAPTYKGIDVGMSGQLDLHGALFHPTWTRLAATAETGDTTLLLQHCVSWEPGQTLFIATTSFKDSRDFNRNDEAEIAAVRCLHTPQGTFGEVTLGAGLQFPHWAGMGSYQAEVGLLSRAIVVRGSSDDSEPTDTSSTRCTDASSPVEFFPCEGNYLTGFGGHIQVAGEGRVSGVELQRMGMTNVLGRYPLHFHMLGNRGSSSYATDNSIHRSYYRCVVLHHTNFLVVARNVAYDSIGNCMYLESGLEEQNTLEFNLVAHVHSIGRPIIDRGQFLDDISSSPALLIPVDKAASCFYISNAYNRFVGNAGSGGYFGMSFVGLQAPMGAAARHLCVDDDAAAVDLAAALGMAVSSCADVTSACNDATNGEAVRGACCSTCQAMPNSRPVLLADGNSMHSTAYFWNLASGVYIGGNLYYSDPTSDDEHMIYNAGRDLSRTRKPADDQGIDVWLTFSNTKLSLVNVAVGDWAVRSEWHNLEVHDVADRSANVFGDVWLDNVLVNCRTGNPTHTTDGSGRTDEMFDAASYKAFRGYDTGQRHILTDWQFSNCAHPSGQYWALPIGVNVPQAQLAIAGSQYITEPNRNTLVGKDVGQKDRFGWAFHGVLDADGTMFSLGSPSIGGSARYPPSVVAAGGTGAAADHDAIDWWSLDWDGSCEVREMTFPFVVCLQRDRTLGSIELFQEPAKNDDDDYFNVIAGRVAHFGQTLEQGIVRSYDPTISGPYNHRDRGGWYVWFESGSPQAFTVDTIQLPTSHPLLLLAISYPPGTTFNVRATTARWCTPRAGRKLCEEEYTAVDSVAAIRASLGNVYHYDEVTGHLYLPIVQNSNKDLSAGTGIWQPTPSDVFDRGGLSLMGRTSSGYAIEVIANCAAGTTSGYCDVEPSVPPLTCPQGESPVGIDRCGNSGGSPSPTPVPEEGTSSDLPESEPMEEDVDPQLEDGGSPSPTPVPEEGTSSDLPESEPTEEDVDLPQSEDELNKASGAKSRARCGMFCIAFATIALASCFETS